MIHYLWKFNSLFGNRLLSTGTRKYCRAFDTRRFVRLEKQQKQQTGRISKSKTESSFHPPPSTPGPHLHPIRERERERISYVSNSFQLCTGAAEINAFSAENLELFTDLSFKAFSRSEYSLACFAYCQEVYVSNFYLHSSSIFIFFNSSLHPTPQLALDVSNAVFVWVRGIR